MDEKGFVTSALLYGVLSLFLVLLLGTVAVIGNRKITNDKIKQSALDDVQNLTTPDNCFTFVLNDRDNYTIINYNNNNCPKTVYIPEKTGGYIVDEIGENAFSNKSIENVTIKSNITRISSTSFTGNGSVKPLLFIIKGSLPSEVGEDGTTSFSGWGASNYTVRYD